MNRTLARLRDRVIRGARLRRGYRVLDVGAGTGLLALDAARKVSSSGSVVAVDPSLDALAVCRSAAESELPLATCIGDGHYLPFAAESFDAVLTRSVLIYLEEKSLAIREIHRVLRKGGVTSIFEPINRAPQDYLRGEAREWDNAELVATHRRVVAHQRRRAPRHEAGFVSFDETDLVRWFIDAGFSSVKLSLEVTFEASKPRAREARALLAMQPNPGALSYEEAANEILGADATRHIDGVVSHMTKEARRTVGAVAYLTARRS
ncbi:MAG TPA: methyltransferase domain-containing protein [Dehalococcoidia bacterium]|nr:methyltransferase domain-containing protein [Dehalococcoidia bacterium]